MQELRAYSEAVHEQQLEKLRQMMESHPEWSTVQIAGAVKEAGAHFAPDEKDAFANSLPFNKTERFLGRLKISSIEFKYPNHEQKGHFAAGTLTWTVRADAELPDGSHPQYVFEFEPFLLNNRNKINAYIAFVAWHSS